jgi:hypothetical protein
MGSLLGLRHPYLSAEPLLGKSWFPFISLFLGIYFLGCTTQVLRKGHRLLAWVLGWLGFVTFFHLLPLLTGNPNWYGATKFYLQTTGVLLLILSSAILLQKNLFRLALVSLPLVLWALFLFYGNFKILHLLPEKTFYYPYAQIEQDLSLAARYGRISCLTRHNNFLWAFQLLAGSKNLEVFPLTADQSAWLARTHRMPLLHRKPGIFRGVIIVDNRLIEPKKVEGSPELISLNDMMGLALDILPSRALVSREKYSIIEGQIHIPSKVSFTITDWVTDEREIELFLSGPHLHIQGIIPENVGYKFPYRFALEIGGQTLGHFSITRPGPFSAYIDLDDRYLNSVAKIRSREDRPFLTGQARVILYSAGGSFLLVYVQDEDYADKRLRTL